MLVDKSWSDLPHEPIKHLKKGEEVALHSHAEIVGAGYASYVEVKPVKPASKKPVKAEALPPVEDKQKAEKK